MKRMGWILLIVGVIFFSFSLFMDTTVSVGFSGRVNNIGLMNDKQNYLMVSIAIIFIGIFILAFERFESRRAEFQSKRQIRACPYCAEEILVQAVMCKHCNCSVEPITILDREPSIVISESHVAEQENTVDEIINTVRDSTKSLSIKVSEYNFRPWMKQLPPGGIIIFISLLIAVVSIFMNWVVHEDFGGQTEFEESSVSNWFVKIIFGSILFCCCWLYPIVMLLKNKSIKLWRGLVGSSISLLWPVFISLSVLNSPGFTVGFGVWVYVLASIVLLVGVLVSSQPRQSVG